MSTVTSMRERIRAAWASPAAPGGRAPRRRDGVLVAIVLAIATAECLLRRDLPAPIAAGALAALLAIGLPWRRSHALAVNVLAAVVATAYEVAALSLGAGQNVLGVVFVAILYPYAMFRWGSGRARIVGTAFQAAGLAVSTAIGGEGIPGAIAGVAFVGGACLVGALRRERVVSRMRELERIRAVERESLARDLHDTVAHHVSAVLVHAQAARVLVASRSDRADDSLALIEAEAQGALRDMRSLVRVLRDTDVPLGPAAGIADLADLATDGPPAVRMNLDIDADRVPDIVAHAVFRIVQEAVTNARRHAHGVTEIDVSVTADERDVSVSVTDNGAAAPGGGKGYGVRGMTERASLLGGRLEAGPDPRGGWRVEAVLPLKERS